MMCWLNLYLHIKIDGIIQLIIEDFRYIFWKMLTNNQDMEAEWI